MTSNNKIGAIALTTALLGGTAGAFITRSTNPAPQPKQITATPVIENTNQPAPLETTSDDERSAVNSAQDSVYRDGFAEGFRAAQESAAAAAASAQPIVEQAPVVTTVQPRRASATRAATSTATRPRYSNVNNGPQYSPYYNEPARPQKRSFWQKHRDKLTVAGGAGGGAIIGGLIGGKKGAAIGALAGGGGSALYTYKIRKKEPRY